MSLTLRVNPVACSGHGLCAELLPELITLDEWGYPLIAGDDVPAGLARRARRAVGDCPALALLLRRAEPGAGPGGGRRSSGHRANSEQAQNEGPGWPGSLRT